jgi:hypothetical protein
MRRLYTVDLRNAHKLLLKKVVVEYFKLHLHTMRLKIRNKKQVHR